MLARTHHWDAFFAIGRNLVKAGALCPTLAILLLAAPGAAEQQAPSPGQPGAPRADAPPAEQVPPPHPAPVTLPAGTELALILTHPIDSKATRRGSTVFAETTAPVLIDDQVVIPAGAFVQGRVERMARQG